MIATISTMGAMDSSDRTPPAAPSATTKPPNTASMVWPASMLANRRTERLMGRVRKEITSIGISRISIGHGALRHEQLEEADPVLRSKPTTITIRTTTSASAKVTVIWLVTVKLTDGRQNSEQVRAQHEHEQREDERKILQPFVPAADWIMLATNS